VLDNGTKFIFGVRTMAQKSSI